VNWRNGWQNECDAGSVKKIFAGVALIGSDSRLLESEGEKYALQRTGKSGAAAIPL